MQKILIVFGTRPEAIKMAPLIKEFEKHQEAFDTKVCVTAQHREMLDQVLNFFEIVPDFDLNLMKPNQNLYQLTADVIVGLKEILEDFKPDYVFVHGDTTTSMAASIASFYFGAKVCHVEAGLRTFNKLSPFPEEINRQITGRITDVHFAPTATSQQNLIMEGISPENIHVVGNTVIDALILAQKKLSNFEDSQIRQLKNIVNEDKKIILVTGHRRENFGDGFLNICKALREIAIREDIQIIYPVHLNPQVQKPVYEILGGIANVSLIDPLGYPAFVWLMIKSYIILTDSGGIQEEAPSLGKPVLVMRNTTERPEAVEQGTVKLVGTDPDKITTHVLQLLNDVNAYETMSLKHNPYGNGDTCALILSILT